MKRIFIVGVVLALAALIPALALGAHPKKGYYEAVEKSGGMPFGTTVAKTKPGKIVDLEASCPEKNQNLIDAVSIEKKIAVNDGKFEFKGKARVTPTGKAPAPVAHKKTKLKGKFTHHFKKWKGTLSVKGCSKIKFKGEFAGTHLGG